MDFFQTDNILNEFLLVAVVLLLKSKGKNQEKTFHCNDEVVT